MSGQNNQLQDAFLTKPAEEGVEVTLYLTSGAKLVGVVAHHDAFSLVLGHQSQPAYKSVISTILPTRPIGLGD